MSLRAFVVCEDHTLDQHLVVPLVEAVLKAAGKPRAHVRAVTSPQLRGISEVEKNFTDIAIRYAAIADLVVFALDRDGLDGENGRKNRKQTFDHLRSSLDEEVAAKVHTVLAVEETEVWAIWGARSRTGAPWATVRAERDPKERFFDPLLLPSDAKQPGAGRKRLITETLAGGWDSLAQGCPELKQLETDLRRDL